MSPKQIRSLRVALRLTQEELGTKLNVARMTIVRWEHGARKPLRKHREMLKELQGGQR